MDRTKLEEAVSAGLSTREIALELGYSQTNVQYWLKKCGLRTLWSRPSIIMCRVCGETDPSLFYWSDGAHTRLRGTFCKTCDNRRVVELQRKRKLEAIDYMGGSCCVCGFNSWASALDIHHLDPARKDPNFNSWTCWSWERIVREMETCVLLCRNCHAGVHEGQVHLGSLA